MAPLHVSANITGFGYHLKGKANTGVRAFFADTSRESVDLYLLVVTIGELRLGVERIRHRGDDAQAKRLGRWRL
jgi:toxin FitB